MLPASLSFLLSGSVQDARIILRGRSVIAHDWILVRLLSGGGPSSKPGECQRSGSEKPVKMAQKPAGHAGIVG